jgi:hypothetical protein
MHGYAEVEVIAPPFLTLPLGGGDWSDLHPYPFKPVGNSPGTNCVERGFGPQSRPRRYEEKNFLPLSEMETKLLSHPARSLIVIPTELSLFEEYIRRNASPVIGTFSKHHITNSCTCALIKLKLNYPRNVGDSPWDRSRPRMRNNGYKSHGLRTMDKSKPYVNLYF